MVKYLIETVIAAQRARRLVEDASGDTAKANERGGRYAEKLGAAIGKLTKATGTQSLASALREVSDAAIYTSNLIKLADPDVIQSHLVLGLRAGGGISQARRRRI